MFFYCIMCLNFVMPGPDPSQQKDPRSVLASLVCLTVLRQGGQRWTIAWEKFVMECPKWKFAWKFFFLLEDCLGKTLSDQITVLTCWKPTSVSKVAGSCGWPVTSCLIWTSREVSGSEIESKKNQRVQEMKKEFAEK